MMEQKAEEILKKYEQEHVISAYNHLNEDGKQKLLSQVYSIDFDLLNRLFQKTKMSKDTGSDVIEPINFTVADDLPEDVREKYIKLGEDVIKNNKYAVVMVAGGQGTRLGHNGPKGTFDIGLDSHKSLFELFCDKLKNARDKYGVTIPWYIMTSRENNDDTTRFFEENDFFGYRDGIKTFFKQGELPMLDVNGKVIIDDNYLIKEAADGHGGIFEAMVANGVLKELKEKGVEWIFTCAVDNPLAKLVDPLLVGYSISNDFKISTASVVKTCPEEHVGVLCKRNNHPSVIEYTELSEEMMYAKDENGNYLYGEAHVMMNLFNIDVIENIAKEKLPYHSAFKKCNYMNEDGEFVVVDKPNAYKFEAFIFDSFVKFDSMGVFRYKREDCFGPVKNAEGVDSPETARKLYKAYCARNKE